MEMAHRKVFDYVFYIQVFDNKDKQGTLQSYLLTEYGKKSLISRP